MTRQCTFHVSCPRPGDYALIESRTKVDQIDRPLCLVHVAVNLTDMEPGDSRLVHRFMPEQPEPERTLHAVEESP